MFQTLLNTLEAGLSLWGSKEKTKFQDQIIRLRKEWHEEFNKDSSERSNAVLDNLESELRIICDSFSTSIRGTNS